MKLLFDHARPEDAEQLCSLFLRYSRDLEQYEMAYTLDEEHVLAAVQGRIKSRVSLAAVVRDNEKAVGFLFCNISRLSGYTYGDSPLFGYISDTYILPEYRGRGIASGLCAMAEDWLRENEVQYVELKVLESNEAAHKFWSGRGFSPTTRVYGKKL